jgi:hypothetical protein
VNPLLELLDTIFTIALGAEEGSWAGRIARASDLDPFFEVLQANGQPYGLERCGESSFCLDDAVLVYEIKPLITPDRKSIVDGALDQLEVAGVAIDAVERHHPGVLSLSGSSSSGTLDVRIVPARGWVFLVNASDPESAHPLVDVLDATIATLEQQDDR